MDNFSAFLGVISSVCGIIGLIIAIINSKKIGEFGIIMIVTILIAVIGAGVFFSTSTTIVPHPPTNPFVPNAIAPPTATPSPTSTPSPTPTLITITKNLDIPYNLCCGIKIDLKLTTIVIDTSKQTSTWSFTLTNNGNYINGIHFTTLVLEDNTGQKHQGGGLASTDSWNMSSGQSIQTYATFDVVHGTNYLLNIAIEYGTYQTETITF